MRYSLLIHPKCRKEINRACKKNPVLRKILDKKINEILINPTHYKPLKHDLAGGRRVHILKSFVLKFKVDEAGTAVKFLSFTHHDAAYRK